MNFAFGECHVELHAAMPDDLFMGNSARNRDQILQTGPSLDAARFVDALAEHWQAVLLNDNFSWTDQRSDPDGTDEADGATSKRRKGGRVLEAGHLPKDTAGVV